VTEAPIAFVGVDGGATRCRARIRDAEGRVLAEANGAAANVHVDFSAAVAVMRAAIGDAMDMAALSPADRPRIALGLGLAGVNDETDVDRIVAAFPGYARVRAANDAVTACIGAHAGADGGLVIAGTGSAAIARVEGRETIVGGRGFAIGDDGSGAHIGLDALRAATRALDGLGPESVLTREIADAFDGDVVALVRWAKVAKPGDYGAFAPRVLACAAEGDPVAIRVVANAAAAVGGLVRRAVGLGARRVALVGGVGEALRPYLDADIAALVTRPLHDATDGAILMAGGRVRRDEEAG
jgi:glucosamine kinase